MPETAYRRFPTRLKRIVWILLMLALVEQPLAVRAAPRANYFKLAKGVWHEGQFIKGIDWIDWALLLDLPAVAIPACMTAIKKRREFKQNLLEAGEEA